MAKFKEKYIDTIICNQLGSFINGPAAAYEICDMAVQITKGKVYVPEDEAFPDSVAVKLPKKDTDPINVEVTFDAEPKKEKIRVIAADCLEISEVNVAAKVATFTVTPKAEAKGTYTNVVIFYGNYTRVFHVGYLEKPEAPKPVKPEAPEVDEIRKSDADVHVGETFKITVSVNKSVKDESALTIEVDDKLEEIEPFACVEGNMRLVGSYKAVKSGSSVVKAKVNDGKITRVLEVPISGQDPVTPEPSPDENVVIESVNATPDTIKVEEDSNITVQFSKAPAGKPELSVNDKVKVKTPLSVSDKTGSATITGVAEGAGEVTVTLGAKSSKKAVTVNTKA